MDECTNAYVLEKILYGLYTTTGRRTTQTFAVAVIDAITRALEPRFDFLKYLTFQVQSDEGKIIKIDSNINSADPVKLGKAIEILVKVVCMDLREKAGLYFINELKRNTDEKVIACLKDFGVDLELIQIQQHYMYRQNRRIKTKTIGSSEEKSLLNYSWDNVTNCEYDANKKICTIYDKEGKILDTLDLNEIVKNYISCLSTEGSYGQSIDRRSEDKEKHLKL